MSEIMHTIFLNRHHILDSAAVLTEEVNSGLNRQNFAHSQRSAERLFSECRTLVNEETNRVTERMTKRTVILGNCIDNISCNLVCLACISACTKIP